MPSVCEACGNANRATAMFCSGCAGRLPRFVATGPSALETMKTLQPSARAPAQDARASSSASLDLRAETPALWLRLGLLGLAMCVGFTGWYQYVTRKGTTPSLPSVARAPVRAPAPQETVIAASLAPPPVAKSAPMPMSPQEAVEKFYRALSAGDGKVAASLVVPAKRGIGPFNESSMSRFYGSFKEPLSIRSIRRIEANVVEAKYSYRVTKTACEGTAIVQTEVVLQDTLIRSIRANC